MSSNEGGGLGMQECFDCVAGGISVRSRLVLLNALWAKLMFQSSCNGHRQTSFGVTLAVSGGVSVRL